MDKISKTLQIQTRGEFRELNERAEQGKLSGSESLPSSSPIWDAWENLKAAYPTSTANWELDPPAVWIAHLADMTGAQLFNGLKNLPRHTSANGGKDFPPNMAQFRDLCLTNFEWETSAHRLDNTGTAWLEDMTAKERRIEQGKIELAGIMGVLK